MEIGNHKNSTQCQKTQKTQFLSDVEGLVHDLRDLCRLPAGTSCRSVS